MILPTECHSATLGLINSAMKAISAVLGCLNYQQLSDTVLAEQSYLHSNVGSRFLCTRIWLFYRKYVYNLGTSFCFSHAIYEDIPGCFSDRNSVEDSLKIILLPFDKKMAAEFYLECK